MPIVPALWELGFINKGLFSGMCPLVAETDLYDGWTMTGSTNTPDYSCVTFQGWTFSLPAAYDV